MMLAKTESSNNSYTELYVMVSVASATACKRQRTGDKSMNGYNHEFFVLSRIFICRLKSEQQTEPDSGDRILQYLPCWQAF